jgi:formylglycine-generating enzyme
LTGALANRPVVFVSWFDAARMANWLTNGQGNSSTETGAYTLNGATSGIITANIGAQVYIPSGDEWFKAAYYNGATSTYSLYPNGTNSITTVDANYNNSVGSSTDVGTYSGDPSFYGTFDQVGNAWEWNDAVIGSQRGLRGGSWVGDDNLASSNSVSLDPSDLGFNLGFRLASSSIAAVPEPTSMLSIAGLLGGGMFMRRRSKHAL